MESGNTVIAGNWKMNHGPSTTRAFLRDFQLPFDGEGPQVMIFPPALSVSAAVESPSRDARVSVGVQNIHEQESGAFTGEVSAPMAVEAGATHVLVGHSERRHVFGETDEVVARKVETIQRHGLVPIVCVGETLEERRAGKVEAVILRQLESALELIPHERQLLIAYEPVWAIGTGETATPEDAAAAHRALRDRLAEIEDEAHAATIPILYGGSVKPGNASELLSAPNVDGVLVGGASLDPVSFALIVEAGL